MPPNCTIEANFLMADRYLYSLMVDPEKNMYFVGILMLIFLNSKKSRKFKKPFSRNGLSISNNNEPTRVSNGRGTLIYVTFFNFFIETKVKSTCITDHHTVVGSFDLDGKRETYLKALKSRNWHNIHNTNTKKDSKKISGINLRSTEVV